MTASWADTFPTRRLRPPAAASPADLDHWRIAARQRLVELLALPQPADPTLIIENDRAADGEPLLITVRTEADDIPCWLLEPPTDRRLGAVAVAIAGHGTGIDALVDASPDANDFHGGLARKLAAAGFTVLCPEMISFGRRRTPVPDSESPQGSSCQVDAMRGLLTGRPVLGRRVADTLAAVRAARGLDDIDPTRIVLIGGSGGGAVALFTAALDDRLPAAVVGSYFSSFAASLGSVPHCICNAVPEVLTSFEMADIAALIAPRRLIIETGRRDPIFPVHAAQSAHAELVGLWQLYDAEPPDLVITDSGHQFVADDPVALLRNHVRSTAG